MFPPFRLGRVAAPDHDSSHVIRHVNFCIVPHYARA
jgi:hypothetical protein